jgi:hypothetical protein
MAQVSVESQASFDKQLGLNQLGGSLSHTEKQVIAQYLQRYPSRVKPRPEVVTSNPVNTSVKKSRFGLAALASGISLGIFRLS